MTPLTHFDDQGQAHMVDVAAKTASHRIGVAGGRIEMQAATLAIIESGSAKKGDVLGIARIAGIMAAKKTSDLIPLCHPLALTRVALEFAIIHADASQYGAVAQCAVQLIQTIVHSRNVSFYLINQTLCTHQVGNLGYISVVNDTPSNCLIEVKNEPVVFLNYSASNYTVVTAYKLYAYGNSQYMSSCPLAIDLS